MRTTQAQWQRHCVRRIPDNLVRHVMVRHSDLLGVPAKESSSPWFTANQWLSAQARELRENRVGVAFDDAAVCEYAANYATRCRRLRPAPTASDLVEFKQLVARLNLAASVGIQVRWPRGATCATLVLRMEDPLWWRRQLRKAWTRSAENSMRGLGLVRKHREAYVSNAAVSYRRAQKSRAKKYLENSIAINELGENIELLKVAEASISNPRLRRGEFMTRVRGFEEVADQFGHVALFVTLTAPSAFHAQLSAGSENPLWERSTVRDAQAWLSRVWARTRAKWKKNQRLVYGFRIAEPHHDGTPHWHMLLFVRQKDAEAVQSDIRQKWTAEFADEKGAGQYRVKFETIDRSRGSATGYIAKYISKNIDGAGSIANERDEETDAVVADSVERVDAWASIHGIRQFQQLGGPAVGLWREARRLRDPADDPDIERARNSADKGRWAEFCRNVGGDVLTRRSSLRLLREETGCRNRYGEFRGPCTIGLKYASAFVISRPYTWRIVRKGAVLSLDSSSPLGPVEITVAGGYAGPDDIGKVTHARAVPWMQPQR